MARPKIGFLPAFFTVLTIAFCLALWLRLRSYSTEAVAGRHSTSSDTTMVIDSRSNATGSPAFAISSSDAGTTIADGVGQPSSRKQARKQTPIIDLTSIPNPAAAPSLTTTTAGGQRPGQRPGDKSSLLSRLVNPLVNALTGSGSHPTSSQPGQQVQSSSSTSTSHGSTSTTDTTGTVDKNDKTSDTTPPQVVSIVFNPTEIHDGETTVITVQATDDITGVRSISGTIASPSGAVQGFALQREGVTDLYSSPFTVPKEAAEGIWKINYLSLIDNASNAATLSGSQGGLPPTASFRVISSNSDTTGPTLKAVWIDRPAMRAGEKNTIFVQVDDDKSGVGLVSGAFISPAKLARIGFVCRQGTGDWECDLPMPTCLDCGDWQLEQVQLQDKANNIVAIRTDNPLVAAVRVNVTGDSCDATPPTLQSIVLDHTSVSNVQESVITIMASASDDMCGVTSMSGQATGPATAGRAPQLYFSFTASDAQSWTGKLTVPKLAAKGVWRVTWIQVLDLGHNMKTYSQGDPPLANAVFRVQ